MAKIVLLALFLVLLPVIALGFNFSIPFSDVLCDEVECGKGKCVGNVLKPLGYSCECEDGWARSPDDHNDDSLEFLPCVIPKCTLNYNGCQPAPPPVPDKPIPLNSSFYDPCYWMFCGEGTCTNNATYNHYCSCKPGFFNLLNVSFFPCYSQCTIGSDCESLGIKVSNSSSSGSSSSNPANSVLPGKFQWMIMLLVSILLVLQKVG